MSRDIFFFGSAKVNDERFSALELIDCLIKIFKNWYFATRNPQKEVLSLKFVSLKNARESRIFCPKTRLHQNCILVDDLRMLPTRIDKGRELFSYFFLNFSHFILFCFV